MARVYCDSRLRRADRRCIADESIGLGLVGWGQIVADLSRRKISLTTSPWKRQTTVYQKAKPNIQLSSAVIISSCRFSVRQASLVSLRFRRSVPGLSF
jgi:hypothetical protein